MNTGHWRAVLDEYERVLASIRGLNAPQEIHLALIESHRFNAFNGRRIVTDLRAHRDKWLAAYHGIDDYTDMAGFLQTLAMGHYTSDTLYLLVAPEHVGFWCRLAYAPRSDDDDEQEADTWGADEEPSLNRIGQNVIIRLWWD